MTMPTGDLHLAVLAVRARCGEHAAVAELHRELRRHLPCILRRTIREEEDPSPLARKLLAVVGPTPDLLTDDELDQLVERILAAVRRSLLQPGRFLARADLWVRETLRDGMADMPHSGPSA
jgi:hypothetical protein